MEKSIANVMIFFGGYLFVGAVIGLMFPNAELSEAIFFVSGWTILWVGVFIKYIK
jgi:hypothetical protein